MWCFIPRWELSCNKVCTCHVKPDFGPLHRTLNTEVLFDSLHYTNLKHMNHSPGTELSW